MIEPVQWVKRVDGDCRFTAVVQRMIWRWACCLFVLCSCCVEVLGQGCISFRGACQQTQSSTFGLEHESGYLEKGHWYASVNYRFSESDRHFIGDEEFTELSDLGEEVVNTQHFIDLFISYAVTPRLNIGLTIPYVNNERSSLYEHSNLGRYSTRASGLGDIRLAATYWVFDPERDPKGNVAIGLGAKLPTGSYDTEDTFMTADGPVSLPVDPSIQPGDGGWGGTVEISGFYKLSSRVALYGQGFYLSNPQDTNGVVVYNGAQVAPEPPPLPTVPSGPPPTAGGAAPQAPAPPANTALPFDQGTGAFGLQGGDAALLANYEPVTSIADQYSARAGVSWLIWPEWGLTVNLGARVDGVPVRDIIGDSSGFRRPGIAVSIEPGLSMMKNGWTVSVSVPVAVYRNRFKSTEDMRLEEITGTEQHGDAAFADYFAVLSVGKEF